MIICNACYGQFYSNCGTWKDKDTYGEWYGIDTISKKPISDTLRNWVYNPVDEALNQNVYSNLVYCPCGCYSDDYWYQYRVCTLTGIKQRRLKTRSWTYTPLPPKPKTEYEKAIDSLNKKQ